MIARLANKQYENEINIFFEKYLDKNNDAISCEEFLCPLGLKAAIKRKQVVIILDDKQNVIASLRFYPRKRDNIVSVYQFAIDKKYRGQNFLKKLLFITDYKRFGVICPINSKFNEYYKKTNWDLIKKDEKYNYWSLLL